MTKHIKLMAEHGAGPMWNLDLSSLGPIDLANLPLKPETVLMLQGWSERYQNRLNWDDPASSNWFTPEEELEFDKEGVQLWLRLREELHPEYQVQYHSMVLGRDLADPRELTYTV